MIFAELAKLHCFLKLKSWSNIVISAGCRSSFGSCEEQCEGERCRSGKIQVVGILGILQVFSHIIFQRGAQDFSTSDILKFLLSDQLNPVMHALGTRDKNCIQNLQKGNCDYINTAYYLQILKYLIHALRGVPINQPSRIELWPFVQAGDNHLACNKQIDSNLSLKIKSVAACCLQPLFFLYT